MAKCPEHPGAGRPRNDCAACQALKKAKPARDAVETAAVADRSAPTPDQPKKIRAARKAKEAPQEPSSLVRVDNGNGYFVGGELPGNGLAGLMRPLGVDLRSPYTTEEWTAIKRALKRERERRPLISPPGQPPFPDFSQRDQGELVSHVLLALRRPDLASEEDLALLP